MNNFAEVILAKTTPKLDKIYHYSIPDELKEKISVGSQVLVPFGKRRDIGYVIGFVAKADVEKTKDIIRITSEVPLFGEGSVELARWMSEYYLSFFISSLRAVMPPGTKRDERREMGDESKKKKKKKKELKSESTLIVGRPLKPTAHQQQALDLILPSISSNKAETILLFGVTSSGKTEVYMQAAAHAMSLGKSSIILVPEVSLTGHLVERFSERFGDQLSVLHSDMKISEREDAWWKISSGRSKVILGTRSAIFVPAKDLGLIVLDEEFETTYKQDQSPRYHTRDVAKHISEKRSAPLILASATPSIESYYKAEKGEYKLARLPERIDKRPLPIATIVDMREERAAKRFGALSKKLREEMKKALSAGQQVILFMNRSGFFTFVSCKECGLEIKCPHCSSPLILHMPDKLLRCGKCSFSSGSNIICSRCQSDNIGYSGIGTQRIEEEVRNVLPNAKIARIDKHTGKGPGSHADIFKSFREGSTNVLVGTQLVTKGLDIENVTLVGAVAADAGLSFPDFRAAEHTFQLLTQVAGRAGRHSLAGRAIIQTYNPEHYAIKHAASQNYENFYNEEIRTREELSYPPFSSLISIIVYGPEKKFVIELANKLRTELSGGVQKNGEILGPIEAPVARLRGNFRYQIVLKGKDLDGLRKSVVESLAKVVSLSGARTSVDIEPQNML